MFLVSLSIPSSCQFPRSRYIYLFSGGCLKDRVLEKDRVLLPPHPSQVHHNLGVDEFSVTVSQGGHCDGQDE